MQALLLERPQEFRFIDVPEPGVPGPGEAVVRVRAVGICGAHRPSAFALSRSGLSTSRRMFSCRS